MPNLNAHNAENAAIEGCHTTIKNLSRTRAKLNSLIRNIIDIEIYKRGERNEWKSSMMTGAT